MLAIDGAPFPPSGTWARGLELCVVLRYAGRRRLSRLSDDLDGEPRL